MACKVLNLPLSWEAPGQKLPEVLEEARDLAGIIEDAADEESETCPA